MERVLKEEGVLPDNEQWSGNSCRDSGDADPTLRQCGGRTWDEELGCRGSIVPTKSLILRVAAGGRGCTQRRGLECRGVCLP